MTRRWLTLAALPLTLGLLAGVSLARDPQTLDVRRLMTAEELSATGVRHLRRGELDAFNLWLTRYTEAVRQEAYQAGRSRRPLPRGAPQLEPPEQPAGLTLERILASPERYAGRGVVVDRLFLDAHVGNWLDLNTLGLESEKGTGISSSPLPGMGNVVFVLPDNVAWEFMSYVESDRRYAARLTCSVRSLETRFGSYWTLEVRKLEIYKRGRVAKTITAQ